MKLNILQFFLYETFSNKNIKIINPIINFIELDLSPVNITAYMQNIKINKRTMYT